MALDVVKDSSDVTTLAGTPTVAVDQHLGSKDSVNTLSSVDDLQTIGKTRKSAMGLCIKLINMKTFICVRVSEVRNATSQHGGRIRE